MVEKRDIKDLVGVRGHCVGYCGSLVIMCISETVGGDGGGQCG